MKSCTVPLLIRHDWLWCSGHYKIFHNQHSEILIHTSYFDLWSPTRVHSGHTTFHFYADDLQLYFPLSIGNQGSIQLLSDHIIEVKTWRAHSFLHLIANKTEVILFGPAKQTKVLKNHLGLFGLLELKFDKQINAVVKGSFFQLQQTDCLLELEKETSLPYC